MRLRYAIPAAALLLLVAPSAFAATGFSAVLSGANENPANASPATGYAEVILNDAETQASFNIVYSGLTSAETGAHFHGPACLPTQNAGVIFTLPLGSPKIGVWNLTPAQALDLKNGCLYVNVHTTNFPGGEIRGNLHRDDSVPTRTLTWGAMKTIYR